MQSLVARTNQKLAARFYGPFKVLGSIEIVTYKLQLPETVKIHPVFHVSLLKRNVGSLSSPQPLLANLFAEVELLVQSKQILDNRKKNVKRELKILVKW